MSETGATKTARIRASRGNFGTLLFALVAYVPFFLANPGRISSDTKAYLYLDPSHLLATATSMWNADQGYGMVTHQNIGYLFPMGPYFWVAHTAHIPVWIAQRFWMGSLLFLAGVGVRRAAEELGLSRLGGWAAAVPYALTPFILVNIGRTSAILMPWAGLGFMMLYAIRATRRSGWQYPAKFALVVALVGGVNATSILLVGLAPALWLLYAVVTREITKRNAFVTTIRIAVLSASVSVWWMAGLWAEGKFGINILQYTETIPTVASSSSSSEVFRGLGYWYFYGWDHSQAWTSAAKGYMSGQVTPIASVLVPTLGFVAALVVRWRYRAFAVLSVILGTAIAVGAYPYNKPTPTGTILKWFGEHTTVGLAMRSTNRVAPIIIFGLALLTGAGLDALRTRRPQSVRTGFLSVIALSSLAMMPLFSGTILARNLGSPETLPGYVLDAASYLNGEKNSGGVLGLPGIDFGYYRWGAYVDSAWPGILRRPFVTSQITLQGEPASVNLVRALDGPIQDLIAEPQTVAPIAQLLGTGDVLLELDSQYERFNGPTPWYLWKTFGAPTSGMTLAKTFGPVVTDQVPDGRYVDESNLGLPTGFSWPPSLAVYHVNAPRPLVRTESTEQPLLVAGDGEGLVALAALGRLPSNRAIFYEGSLSSAALRAAANAQGASLVLTDSNQRRLNSYGTLHSSPGYVQTADETPVVFDPAQQPLAPFQPVTNGTQTVAILQGVRAVQASSYGNPIANNPEVQPYFALDGNTATAWQTAAFANAIGQFLQIRLLQKTNLSSLHITQPQSSTINRWITRVGIYVDGRHVASIHLPPTTRTAAGGDISFGPTRGTTVRLVIEATTGKQSDVGTASGVGFAEVGIPGIPSVQHSLLLPTSLLRRIGTSAASDSLSIVVTRARVATTPPRLDPEPNLDRTFVLPYGRTFTISGSGSLNPAISDPTLNSLLGRTGGAGTSVIATDASTRLVGSLNASSWSAFDGTTATAWMPAFQTGEGQWLQATTSNTTSVSNFTISVINDGLHAVPTEMTVSDGTQTERFTTGLSVNSHATRGALSVIHVSVPALTGRTFRFTATKLRYVTVKDRVSGGLNHPPIGIAEIDIPGVTPGRTPANYSTGCRNDLLSIDGTPIPVVLSATTAAALDQQQIALQGCGAAIHLAAGTHHLTTSVGGVSGVNVDRLLLDSPTLPLTNSTAIVDASGRWTSRSSLTSNVGPGDAGQWVVLGQSFGPGWHARLNGKDLGAATLIDGAAMGWRLPSTVPAGSHVTFRWTPQATINDALIVSAVGLLLCALLASRRGKVRYRSIDDVTPRWRNAKGIQPRKGASTWIVAIVLGLLVSWWLVPAILITLRLWRRRPNRSVLIAMLSTVLILGGDAITVWATRQHFKTDLSWPIKAGLANSFTWCALALWALFVLLSTQRGEFTTDLSVERAGRTSLVERRRGLNVPTVHNVEEQDEKDLLPIVVAPHGFLRSLALVRAFLIRHRNPILYQKIVAADTMNQVVGNTPLFNRQVLEIADSDTSYADGFVERGAVVTCMRRQAPSSIPGFALPPDSTLQRDIEYSPLRIPSPDQSFDLVFATNVLSSVDDPYALINELIRVTKRGGALHIHNTTWFSPWGGRETSPWHLLSGNYARKRYTRLHGRPPVNAYGLTFFRMRLRETMDALHHDSRIIILSAHPRYLPPSFGWILRIPILRELLTMNLSVAIERRINS